MIGGSGGHDLGTNSAVGRSATYGLQRLSHRGSATFLLWTRASSSLVKPRIMMFTCRLILYSFVWVPYFELRILPEKEAWYEPTGSGSMSVRETTHTVAGAQEPGIATPILEGEPKNSGVPVTTQRTASMCICVFYPPCGLYLETPMQFLLGFAMISWLGTFRYYPKRNCIGVSMYDHG